MRMTAGGTANGGDTQNFILYFSLVIGNKHTGIGTVFMVFGGRGQAGWTAVSLSGQSYVAEKEQTYPLVPFLLLGMVISVFGLY